MSYYAMIVFWSNIQIQTFLKIDIWTSKYIQTLQNLRQEPVLSAPAGQRGDDLEMFKQWSSETKLFGAAPGSEIV